MDWVFPLMIFLTVSKPKKKRARYKEHGDTFLKTPLVFAVKTIAKLTDFTKIEDDRSSFDGISVSNK